jgi:hypothetical protein
LSLEAAAMPKLLGIPTTSQTKGPPRATEPKELFQFARERTAVDLFIPNIGRAVMQNMDGCRTPVDDLAQADVIFWIMDFGVPVQFISATTRQSSGVTVQSDAPTSGELVARLAAAQGSPPAELLCTIEMARFAPQERDGLLPLLWQYIVDHRDSNDRNELVGVAAAIRKYVAIMPMERIGELAELLEAGHRSPLPIELVIEVAKMIYRNFEVCPPPVADPQPKLADRLYDVVLAYIHPRVLLLEKCSAAASLAIEAIVAMRSPLAESAWKEAMACPYHWFAELVSDEIDELHEKWRDKGADAAVWLDQLRNTVMAVT